jgi:endonuclease/exonuclease/phosphatase (EEP) superfamily protein YafD
MKTVTGLPKAMFLLRLAWAFVRVYVAAMLLWNILRYYPGDRWLPVRLGSYFAPWLAITLIIMLIFTLLARRFRLAVVTTLAVLLMSLHFTYLLPFPAPPANADQSTTSFKVMTINVHFHNDNTDAIVAMIESEQPAIAVIQELTPVHAGLLEKLAEQYPHQLSAPGGQAIISQYPLEMLPTSPEAGRAQQALVHLPAGPVVVWNLHPPPAVSQAGWQIQHRAFTTVAQQIALTTTPTIVLGDFNTTVYAENYEIIAAGLTNASQVAGGDFAFSFPHPGFIREHTGGRAGFGLVAVISPLVRIDHILVSSHFTPVASRVLPGYIGSDHYPVTATLAY